jgi:hypothetical protein
LFLSFVEYLNIYSTYILTWPSDSKNKDYFVGTPENLRPQAATAATEPALKRSRSFMEWYILPLLNPHLVNLLSSLSVSCLILFLAVGSLVSAADKLQTRLSIGKPGGGVIARKTNCRFCVVWNMFCFTSVPEFDSPCSFHSKLQILRKLFFLRNKKACYLIRIYCLVLLCSTVPVPRCKF